jgi:hypothetical protein
MLIGFVPSLFLVNYLMLVVCSRVPQSGASFLRMGNGEILAMVTCAAGLCRGGTADRRRLYFDGRHPRFQY